MPPQEVSSSVLCENTAMLRLAKKLGFVPRALSPLTAEFKFALSELILGICQHDIGHHLISFLAPSTASYIHPCSTRKKHPSAKNNQTTDEKFRWMREHLAKIP